MLEGNPFAVAPGQDPPVYIDRAVADRERLRWASTADYSGYVPRVDYLFDSLEAGRFALGVGLNGLRGIGKSLELQRLRSRALAAGIVPVMAVLAEGVPPELSVLSALNSALGTPNARGAPESMRASLGISVGPTKIGLEHIGGPPTSGQYAVAEVVVDALDEGHVGGFVFLVDEGDYLNPNLFEATLGPVLWLAAENSLPVSFVAVGATHAFDESVFGTNSAGSSLVGLANLRRLTGFESSHLLVDVAATAGQEWYADELGPVIGACHGIPRDLFEAGRRLWESPAKGWSAARVQRAADELARSRQRVLDAFLRTQAQRAVARTVAALCPVGVRLAELEEELLSHVRSEFVPEVGDALIAMQRAGVLEINVDTETTYLPT